MIKEVSNAGIAHSLLVFGWNVGQFVMVIFGFNQLLGGSSAWSNSAFVTSGCILLNITFLLVIKIVFAVENEYILKNRSGEKTSSKKFGQMVMKFMKNKSELKIVVFASIIFFVILQAGGLVALTSYSMNSIFIMGFRSELA